MPSPFPLIPRPHRRRQNRSLKTLAPGLDPGPPVPPGPALVFVLSVENLDGQTARWTFSQPLVCGNVPCPQLIIETPAGPVGAFEVFPLSATEIYAYYEADPPFAAGAAWHVHATPENLDFSQGGLVDALFVLPQEGVVG
jgi:hypothetical protein